MKNPPAKKPKAISLILVQAELIRELAREQIALTNDIIKLVREVRELHNYARQIGKAAPVRANADRQRVIPFPVTRVQ